MKRNVLIIALLMFSMLSLSSYAQIKIPKKADLNTSSLTNLAGTDVTKDLLGALAPDKSLGLSSELISKLTGNNESFVNKALGIIGGSGSDDDKKLKIGALQKDRKDFIENLLGEGKATEYYKLAKEKVQPILTKYALSKFFS
jgi:hypothetical protein